MAAPRFTARWFGITPAEYNTWLAKAAFGDDETRAAVRSAFRCARLGFLLRHCRRRTPAASVVERYRLDTWLLKVAPPLTERYVGT